MPEEAERRNAMDPTMIRIICAVAAALLLVVVVVRRRRKAE
jgi:hypothetical protein